MEITVISKLENGEEIKINERGFEKIEIDPIEIQYFSLEGKVNRFIGLGKKGVYRLSLRNFKDLKRKLLQQGLLQRFNYTKRAGG